MTPAVRAEVAKHGAFLPSLAVRNLAYTIIAESGTGSVRVVGVAGAVPLNDKTVEVFIVAAEDCSRWRVEFVKSVRQVLDHARENFARIEALAGEGVSPRWFEWLGFTRAADGRWAMEGKT